MPLDEYMDVSDKLHKAVVDLLDDLLIAYIDINEEVLPDEDKKETVLATLVLAAANIIEEVHKHD